MTAQTLTLRDADALTVGYPALDRINVFDPDSGRYVEHGLYPAGGPFNSGLAAQALANEFGLGHRIGMLAFVGAENPPDMSEFHKLGALAHLIELDGWLRENTVLLGGDSDDEPKHAESTFWVTDDHIGQLQGHLDILRGNLPVAFTGSLAPGESPWHRAAMIRQVKCQGGIPVVDTRPKNIRHMLAADPTVLDGVIVKQNKAEFTDLVSPDPTRSWADQARDFLPESTWVITQPDCTLVVEPHRQAQRIHLPKEFWPQVVCRVGCGDCTVAGIVIGLILGLNIVDAVRLGKGASQANVEFVRPGAFLAERALWLASRTIVDPVN